MSEPTDSPAYFRPPPATRPYGAPDTLPVPAAVAPDAATAPALAGPGRRLLARVIDGLLVGLIASPVTVPLVGRYLRYTSDAAASGIRTDVYDQRSLQLLTGIALVSLVVSFLYEVPQLARWGQTLGKRICRVRVVRRDGRGGAGIGPAPAAMRWLVSGGVPAVPYVGTVIAILDSLWLLWDRPWRQCLHDKVAATIVVRVGR